MNDKCRFRQTSGIFPSVNRHRRMQLIIDDKTNIELSSIIFRHTRLNVETNTSEHPVTKQDVLAAAIHKYALELGVECDPK